MVGEDLEGDSVDEHSQSTPSSAPSNIVHFSGTISQAKKNNSSHSSQQQKTDPFPINRTSFSRNLESLTRGATAVLAARKAHSSSQSSNAKQFQTTRSETTTIVSNINSDEALMDELLFDFNDFSEDGMDDVQTSSIVAESDPHSSAVSQMDTCSTESTLREVKIASKESSFFSKRCEGTSYILDYYCCCDVLYVSRFEKRGNLEHKIIFLVVHRQNVTQ